MAVFSKKATIKFQDKNAPMRELNLYLSDERFRGIDAIVLKDKSFQNEYDIELICSDINPSYPRDEADLDELLARFQLTAAQRIRNHPNDPLKANNHLYEAITNLDNPNIDDTLRSRATRLRTEHIDKADVKKLNERFDNFNAKLSETSTDNSSRLKHLDEKKTEFSVGEIERG